MLAKASLMRIKNTFTRNELQELIIHQLFIELSVGDDGTDFFFNGMS